MKQVASVGTYGATVTLLQRRKGGRYILRWTDLMTGKKVVKTTEFTVLTKAKEAAMEKSQDLLKTRHDGPSDGRLTWNALFRYYEEHLFPLQEGKRQHKVDRHCLDVWRAVLPANEAVDDLESHVLLEFIRQRKAGTLVVPGRSLKPCGERAPGMELEWLRRVVNIAKDNHKAVAKNPVSLIKIPRTGRPSRPSATWDRFETLRTSCPGVGSQDIFGGFMDLVVGLGWRVSALACLHVSDIDRRPHEKAPNGWILKRSEFDKMGITQYVPISDWLAPRVDALLERRSALDVVSPWLFPSPVHPDRPWTKDYVKDRLRSAERKAGLAPMEGGDFHPWRRMWASMRKHMPVVDVAYAGCWDVATLLKHYQLADDRTVYGVMNAGMPVTPDTAL
jgi:hypothetical protein